MRQVIKEEKAKSQSKSEQLDEILNETITIMADFANRIIAWCDFEAATDSNYDKAIGYAIRIRAAIRQVSGHIHGLGTVPVQRKVVAPVALVAPVAPVVPELPPEPKPASEPVKAKSSKQL